MQINFFLMHRMAYSQTIGGESILYVKLHRSRPHWEENKMYIRELMCGAGVR